MCPFPQPPPTAVWLDAQSIPAPAPGEPVQISVTFGIVAGTPWSWNPAMFPTEGGPFYLNADGYEFGIALNTYRQLIVHHSKDWIPYNGNPPYDALTLGETHHIVVTWDADLPLPEAKIYIDGQLYNTFEAHPASDFLKSDFASEIRFQAGHNLDDWEANQDWIDEFALFPRVLTQEEVTELWVAWNEESVTPTPPPPTPTPPEPIQCYEPAISQLERDIPYVTAFRRLMLSSVLRNPELGNDSRAIIWMALQSEFKAVLLSLKPALKWYENVDIPNYKQRIQILDEIFQPYYHQIRLLISKDLPVIGASATLVNRLLGYDVEHLRSPEARVHYVCFLIILAAILTYSYMCRPSFPGEPGEPGEPEEPEATYDPLAPSPEYSYWDIRGDSYICHFEVFEVDIYVYNGENEPIDNLVPEDFSFDITGPGILESITHIEGANYDLVLAPDLEQDPGIITVDVYAQGAKIAEGITLEWNYCMEA